MTRRIHPLAAILALLLSPIMPAALAEPITTLVSATPDGWPGNDHSGTEGLAISGNGRYVAFGSRASDLVPDDANEASDIFLRDLLLGFTRIISVASDGTPSNGPSTSPRISADGRFVVFLSEATNLVPGAFGRHVYYHDTLTGTTSLVTVTPSGEPANPPPEPQRGHEAPAISADGRAVAFVSGMDNLVPNDAGGRDVFVRDMAAGQTRMVSVRSDGSHPTTGDEFHAPGLSADGRYVRFTTDRALSPLDPTSWLDVYRYDLKTGQVALVSASLSGASVEGGAISEAEWMSGDGQTVLFEAVANDMVPGQGDTFPALHLYSRDMATGRTAMLVDTLVGARLSPDLRFTSFDTQSSLLPEDDNAYNDVYWRDLLTRRLRLVSIGADGLPSDDISGASDISDDGRAVAFASLATNLAPDGFSPYAQVYVRSPMEIPVTPILPDVIRALRLAGGLSPATAGDLARLDVVPEARARIDVRDVVRLLRQMVGTDE